MFTTAPGLVQYLHPSQVAPRQSHWPAITLSMERPWCLLVYDVSYNGQKLSQTSLVAWDNTLLDLLAKIPVTDLKGIARLDRRRDSGPSWSFNWIDALWTPAPCEAPSVGALLFKLSDDPHVRNGRMQPMPGAPGRRLLYQAPPWRTGSIEWTLPCS
ncbi:MAG: hypothetical protein GTN84_09560 [Hydrogenophaga sp.]|uniref:hypothetical protein n=1 Tax=Hydrogenophaga sp. TaxID=1904254 RepID=UPI0016B5FBB7|nr:hypothetical protein [Hydrogenophaga sp.]NIM41340.1 hypothetical protein [Hydrogenophaga sp.]NIN26656.1 hypothetical protein [Hydrogenophaga sp.]NIN29978.1 hypothetical protein [Hydrogenophaga sp.]NIN55586.1 hypothetical protein [Hydrogenophaga sp.]NIO52583.1 hypothetical protein [Hydrogenophaga sp.]